MSAILADIITVIILMAVVITACLSLYRQKKKGGHCACCPMAGGCTKHGKGCKPEKEIT